MYSALVTCTRLRVLLQNNNTNDQVACKYFTSGANKECHLAKGILAHSYRSGFLVSTYIVKRDSKFRIVFCYLIITLHSIGY